MAVGIHDPIVVPPVAVAALSLRPARSDREAERQLVENMATAVQQMHTAVSELLKILTEERHGARETSA